MASTTFVNQVTVIQPDWLNEVNGTVWTLFNAADTPAEGRTALGLGTIATQAANSVAITGGTITGLSSALPVASGGTGSTTSTGTGSVVLQASPTITGTLSTNSSTGNEFVSFVNTASGSEPSVRLDATSTTSGISVKLSNSGLNKQTTLRGNSDGGFTLYTNQTAGGASTSGTNALTVTGAGAANFPVSVSENNTRVFSRNSMAESPEYNLNSINKTLTWDSGLGVQPTWVQVFLKNVSTDAGFAAGDIIYLSAMSWTGGSIAISANSGSDVIVVNILGNINLVQTAAPPTTSTNIDFTKWNIFVRAWY